MMIIAIYDVLLGCMMKATPLLFAFSSDFEPYFLAHRVELSSPDDLQ
jgi:hypothetical protein